jgi:hypothetical protein
VKLSLRILAWATVGFLAIGLALIGVYESSGQYVDETGVLVEQFWAVAVGTVSFAFAAISAVTSLALLVVSRLRKTG